MLDDTKMTLAMTATQAAGHLEQVSSTASPNDGQMGGGQCPGFTGAGDGAGSRHVPPRNLLGQVVDGAVGDIVLPPNEPTVVVRTYRGDDTHTVTAPSSQVPAVVESIRQALVQAGISGCSVTIEGTGVLTRWCLGLTDGQHDALEAVPLGESFRMSSEGVTMLMWLRVTAPNPSRKASSSGTDQHAEACHTAMMDAALVGIERPHESGLPLGAAKLVWHGSGTSVDFSTWTPRLVGIAADFAREFDVTKLGLTPLSWVVLELVRLNAEPRWGSRAAASVVRAFAIAHIVAHLKRADEIATWRDRVDGPWQSLLQYAKSYVNRLQVEEATLKTSPPLRIAFDVASGRLSSVTSTYALENWLEREPEGVLMKRFDSEAAPTVAVRELKLGKGKDAPWVLRLTFVPVAGVSSQRVRGSKETRVRMGIPDVNFHQYPVAHETTSLVLEEAEGDFVAARYTRVPEPSIAQERTTEQATALTDPVAWMVGLYRRGGTPFRAEGDVRRFCMLVAAPLLRKACAGRLPAFLLEGPSGSGKGLSKDALFAAWNAAKAPGAPSECYLDFGSDDPHELNLKYATMGPRTFVSMTEIAKAGMADSLIRLTERETVSARAHHGSPMEIPNAFVYIADAVEGLPERVEVNRRVVRIQMRNGRRTGEGLTVLGEVAPDGAAFVPAEFVRTLRELGPYLIEGFRRQLDGRGERFLEEASNDSGRSAASVALAELCGVPLDVVSGGDLLEYWNLMVDLTIGTRVTQTNGMSHLVRVEARPGGAKDGLLAKRFGKYSLAALLKQASGLPEHSAVTSRVSASTVEKQIGTEFGSLFVSLHRNKAHVLVVFAREQWWVYSSIKDACVFAPYAEVEKWAGSHLGPDAIRNLRAAKTLSARRFKVPTPTETAMQDLLEILRSAARPEEFQDTDVDRMCGLIAGAYPGATVTDLPPGARRALAKRAKELQMGGVLEAEIDLLADPTADLAVRAGLTAAASRHSAETIRSLVTGPGWSSFCRFRLLYPVFVDAPHLVIRAGVEGGVLKDEEAWLAATAGGDLGDANSVVAQHGNQEFYLDEEAPDEFEDATMEEVAAWSAWSSDGWGAAA